MTVNPRGLSALEEEEIMKAFEAERVLRRMTALPDQVGGGVGGPVGGAPAVGQARGG